VNGLDPEGILWIRTLLRSLAAEGRTVFVSSHLMSEMALTADHLIVVGQGRLIADASTAHIIEKGSRAEVVLSSPKADQFAELLRRAGAADVRPGSMPQSLHVLGLSAAEIGDLAAANQIALHELSPRQASLEEAFMTLTHDSVEFRPEKVA
jgi:ABC-2 type transport system ATP-binding protein